MLNKKTYWIRSHRYFKRTTQSFDQFGTPKRVATPHVAEPANIEAWSLAWPVACPHLCHSVTPGQKQIGAVHDLVKPVKFGLGYRARAGI